MTIPVRKQTFWSSGEFMVWATRLTLTVLLLMTVGLLVLVAVNGMGHFWPHAIALVEMHNGDRHIGEVQRHDSIETEDGLLTRSQLKIGNRDIYGLDFMWLDDPDIAAISYPQDLVVIERVEKGNMYGKLVGVGHSGKEPEPTSDPYAAVRTELEKAVPERQAVKRIEDEIGEINATLREIQEERRRAELAGDPVPADAASGEAEAEKRYEDARTRLNAAIARLRSTDVVVEIADGRQATVELIDVVRVVQPNTMTTSQKLGHYLKKVWEFVAADPRNSNTEGGVFPAIFGTVLMVLIMTIAVVPLGVLAALYLHEYAKQGPIVRMVRLAVNNLAGVPSIVFGIFGLGMFVYVLGGSIDGLFFPERLPTPTFGTGGILWASLTLALLTVPVVVVATEEALGAVRDDLRHGSIALGSTKWQTIWRVVLPSAAPGILTGMILAVARGAGEVAPLMLTGVVKAAPTLPLDGSFPFLHLDRKFMHLGFHIYDVGFQSPNVEAATPMVYTTTLLLLGIVVVLNALAIILRTRLRARLRVSGV